MTEIDEEGRAILELARDAHDPSGEDRARVRGALAARLGTAAGLGIAASVGMSAKAAAAASASSGVAGTGATAAVAVGGTLATKLIGVLVIAGAVGGGAAVVHRARRVPSPAAVAELKPGGAGWQQPRNDGRQEPRAMTIPELSPPGSDQDEDTTQPADVGPVASNPLQRGVHAGDRTVARMPEKRVAVTHAATKARSADVLPPEARLPEAPDHGAAAVALPPARASQDAGTATRPPPPALAGEGRLVRDGVAALRAGEPARALALFDAHAMSYPRGVLAMERAAERVVALAELGRRAEAHAALDEFLRTHPASPLAPRLRRRIAALDGADDGEVPAPARGGSLR